MPYETLFFDLDQTIYTGDSGLWWAIASRMNRYMIERVGIPVEKVPRLRHRYYKSYGTTLRGLQRHHNVCADDYLRFVHDIDLREYLQPEPQLRAMLLSLPQRRWIFTNADSNHASRVLETMDLGNCFNGIIDIRAMNFVCKPDTASFHRAFELSGFPLPEDCVMFDDSLENLQAARGLGLTTVFVGEQSNSHPAVSYTVPNLLQLPEVMPGLWGSA